MPDAAISAARLDWLTISVLAFVTGIAMGAATSYGLTQDSIAVELAFWTVWACVWVLVVIRVKTPRPFLTLLLIGVLSGLFVGIVSQILWTEYLSNNAETFTRPTVDAGDDPESGRIRATHLALSPAIGLAWGAIVGGVFLGVRRVRARRAAAA